MTVPLAPPPLLSTPVLSWLHIASMRCPVTDDKDDVISPASCILDAVINDPGDVTAERGFA